MNDKLNFRRPLNFWDRALLLALGAIGVLASVLVFASDVPEDLWSVGFQLTMLACAQFTLFALLYQAFSAIADLLILVHRRSPGEADDSSENVLEEADEANGEVLAQGPEARAEHFIRNGRRNPPPEPESE